jgi:hypothetical protein
MMNIRDTFQAKNQPSSPHSLSRPLRIETGLVPRNDTARFVWPLVAAGHDKSVLIIRIVHEIFRVAANIRIVIRPEIVGVVHFLSHYRARKMMVSKQHYHYGTYASRGNLQG